MVKARGTSIMKSLIVGIAIGVAFAAGIGATSLVMSGNLGLPTLESKVNYDALIAEKQTEVLEAAGQLGYYEETHDKRVKGLLYTNRQLTECSSTTSISFSRTDPRELTFDQLSSCKQRKYTNQIDYDRWDLKSTENKPSNWTSTVDITQIDFTATEENAGWKSFVCRNKVFCNGNSYYLLLRGATPSSRNLVALRLEEYAELLKQKEADQ